FYDEWAIELGPRSNIFASVDGHLKPIAADVYLTAVHRFWMEASIRRPFGKLSHAALEGDNASHDNFHSGIRVAEAITSMVGFIEFSTLCLRISKIRNSQFVALSDIACIDKILESCITLGHRFGCLVNQLIQRPFDL